jgi:hypothetical protein
VKSLTIAISDSPYRLHHAQSSSQAILHLRFMPVGRPPYSYKSTMSRNWRRGANSQRGVLFSSVYTSLTWATKQILTSVTGAVTKLRFVVVRNIHGCHKFILKRDMIGSENFITTMRRNEARVFCSGHNQHWKSECHVNVSICSRCSSVGETTRLGKRGLLANKV